MGEIFSVVPGTIAPGLQSPAVVLLLETHQLQQRKTEETNRLDA